MKKSITLSLLFFVIIAFVDAQISILCPPGDNYTCYTHKDSNGTVVTVYKGGEGETTIIIR